MTRSIIKFSDSLNDIFQEKGTTKQWLDWLAFFPFCDGYSRLDFWRKPSDRKFNQLRNWAMQAYEKAKLLAQNFETEQARTLLSVCLRSLYHLEYLLPLDNAQNLDQLCRNIWERTYTRWPVLSRVAGGLLCVLFTHKDRPEAEIENAVRWIVESFAAPAGQENKRSVQGKEMLLRNLLTFSQALPDRTQRKLLDAIGYSVSVADADPEWRDCLSPRPGMHMATREICREAGNALCRLHRWRDNYERASQEETCECAKHMTRPLVISMHSHKGGVGKTSLALALALLFANEGRKVRVVDTDFMASSWGLILDYENLDWECFAPIEDYIGSFLPSWQRRREEIDQPRDDMWKQLWLYPKGILSNGGDLGIALTSPFAHKRTEMISCLYSSDFMHIGTAYADIVSRAARDGVECLIFDNSAGIWGFSFVSLRQAILNKGMAILISCPDMHDIVGSLLEMAAIRDLVEDGLKHYTWVINRIPAKQIPDYSPGALARRLSANPILDIFKNMDLATRLIETKFLIADKPLCVTEHAAMKIAFLHSNRARMDCLMDFSEEESVSTIFSKCRKLLRSEE